MKKKPTQIRFLLLVCLFSLGIALSASATAWTTVAAGPITTLTNWTDGTSSPATFTTPGDTWTVTMAMTMTSSGSWTLGTASAAPVTLTFSTGGTLSISGAGGTATINIYGDMAMNGGTFSLGGAGTTANTNVNGNLTFTSGTISSAGATSHFYIYTYGNYAMSGGTVTTASAASGVIGLYVHGNFAMKAGTFNTGGAGCSAFTKVYGNCHFSGTAALTATGSNTNTIHLALPGASGTMLAGNTSTGTWSNTSVFVDTGCVAQLDSNFKTTTGSAAYGLTVDGTLICPAADTVTGAGKFILNGVASLIVGHANGVNGAVINTGTRTLSNSANYGFNGTVPQVTGTNMPAALITPDSIMINNSAGVTLSQNTSTTGTLAFTSGILSTGSYTMTTTGAASSVAGAGTGSYVNGLLAKTIAGYTTVSYEVGDLSYAPMTLTLSAAGTGGTLAVRATNGLHPNVSTSGFSTSHMYNHYWTVTDGAAAGPTTVIPKTTCNLADILGGTNGYFVTQKYNGTAWLASPLATTNTSSPYTSAPNSGIALASLAGDYIFGNVATTLGTTHPQVANISLQAFPNPNCGVFNLNVSSADNEDVVVVITNTLGEKVREFVVAANKITTIALNQPAGVYMLSVRSAQGNRSAKIIVQ